MKRKLLKILVVMLSAFFMANSAVLAAYKSDTFSYNNKVATGSLDVNWSADSYDDAKARTEWSTDTTYKVTAYLEAQNFSGDVLASRFDSGFTWAENNISLASVWRYNSTHGIALATNVYEALSVLYLTDW